MSLKKIFVQRILPKNIKEGELDLFKHELEKSFKIPEIDVLKNVVVDSNGKVRLHTFGSWISRNRTANTLQHNCDTLKEIIKIKINRNVIELQNACWISDDWSLNYFHWMCDCLTKLSFVEKNYPDYIILLPEKLLQLSFVINTLKLFKIKFQPVKTFEKIKAKNFISVTNLVPTGHFIPEVIEEIQSKFSSAAKQPTRRIFVQRTGGLSRKILNQDDLYSVLKTQKFEIIDLDKMDWIKQVKLFSETKVLIGVHGAALTNMIFMPRGGKVLEFRKDNDTHNNCYFSLASAVKQDYYYQLCKVDLPEQETQQNNFVVDKVLMEKNIDLILQDV